MVIVIFDKDWLFRMSDFAEDFVCDGVHWVGLHSELVTETELDLLRPTRNLNYKSFKRPDTESTHNLKSPFAKALVKCVFY